MRYGDVRDRMTGPQLQEHGRLVARVRKMARRADERQTEVARENVLRAVTDLMILEDRVVSVSMGIAPSAVTASDLQARLRLMSRGAGLELAR